LTLNSSNYIGHTVEAKGDTATLENGQVAFGYSLNSAASSVTLTVSDSSGNAVWTGSGTTTAGSNSFTWDGKTTDGTQLSDGGQYTLSVSAKDSSGNSVYGYTTVSGTVTAVGTDEFTGFRTRRTGALIARSVTFRELAAHPFVLGVLGVILPSAFFRNSTKSK
jgi:flagellar basal-body rod modification protein FlgD